MNVINENYQLIDKMVSVIMLLIPTHYPNIISINY